MRFKICLLATFVVGTTQLPRNQYGSVRPPVFVNYPFYDVWQVQNSLPWNMYTPYHLIDEPPYRYCPPNIDNRTGYEFRFDTGKFRKNETSDRYGNVSGRVEFDGFDGNLYTRVYNNSNRGNFQTFPALTENLQQISSYLNDLLNSFYNLPYVSTRDGSQNRSYYFLFDTGKFKTEEFSDQNGNIRGFFQFSDDRGQIHDLNYVTDKENGFLVTGGNLADSVSNTDGRNGPAIVIGQSTSNTDI